ncbi:MAG: divalent metal cation transporter [Balneolaceae bacterium]
MTTAASAGAGYGYALIWALIFSTIACYVLQEASARITAVSGMNLGEAMRQEYGGSNMGKILIYLALVAVLTGCAAYEAGNVLGAVAGIHLVRDTLSIPLVVFMIGLISAILLWRRTVQQIAILLGFVVAFMGICFLITVWYIPHNLMEILSGGFLPRIPSGSEILVLGLIGTTVVPYGIFLGSGLKHNQTVAEMKFSLMIAIGLGGVISIAILLTGTAIMGEFTFIALADTLSNQLGAGADWLLGFGLFGAGLSSTLTAALAGSITAKSLLASDREHPKWSENGIYFRSVWMTVLGIGLLFGLLGFRPVPIIILAQALNGVILPIIAIILFLLMNNDRVLSQNHQNGLFYNLVTSIVVYLTVLIGLTNLFRSISGFLDLEVLSQKNIVILSILIYMIVLIPIGKVLMNRIQLR